MYDTRSSIAHFCRGHKDAVRAIVTHKNLLFSCGDDLVIKVWDLEALTKGCFKTMTGHKDCVSHYMQ